MELAQALQSLETATRTDLTTAWQAAFKAPPPSGTSQPFMRLALGFHIQSKQFGGLNADTKRAINRVQKNSQLADKTQTLKSSKLAPGAHLLREWNGTTHRVDILDNGFRWKGQTFRSLSAIAHAITGTRWSGPRFFGLKKAAS